MHRSRMIQRLRFCGGLSGSSRLYKIKPSIPKRYVRIGNNTRRQCLLFFEISLHRNRVWCSLIRTRLHLTPVLESAPASTPRAVCREAAVSIMQKLPPSLVDHTTLSKASIFTCSDSLIFIPLGTMQMSYLIFDPSKSVQQMAYELLREAA